MGNCWSRNALHEFHAVGPRGAPRTAPIDYDAAGDHRAGSIAGRMRPVPVHALSAASQPGVGRSARGLCVGAVALRHRSQTHLDDAADDGLCVDRSDRTWYGRCDVSIPENHGRGRLETPLFGFAPDRCVTFRWWGFPSVVGEDEFLQTLRTQVAKSERREVFVFVHGYYTSFAESVRLTAQIAHDIDFDGVAIAYSWPSEAWLAGYLIDGVNAEWTIPHLAEFLEMLANESEVEHIHLMAHSMGTRALVRAIREYMRDREGVRRRRLIALFCARPISTSTFSSATTPRRWRPPPTR